MDDWYEVPNLPHTWTEIHFDSVPYDQEFRDVFNVIDVMFLEANGIEPYAEATWTRD